MTTHATTTPTQLRLAKRMARLGTETAFEVLLRARTLEAQGRDIIHLEIGEPDFDTPANVIDAGVQAIHNGWTHYSPSAGLPALREAIGMPLPPNERSNQEQRLAELRAALGDEAFQAAFAAPVTWFCAYH